MYKSAPQRHAIRSTQYFRSMPAWLQFMTNPEAFDRECRLTTVALREYPSRYPLLAEMSAANTETPRATRGRI